MGSATKDGSRRTTSAAPVCVLKAMMFPSHESARRRVWSFNLSIPLIPFASGKCAILVD